MAKHTHSDHDSDHHDHSHAHCHGHAAATKGPEVLLKEAIEHCREAGMRRTRALEDVLSILIHAKGPLTLADISESKQLSSGADKATVYRLLLKLEERAIIRRLGLHDRSAYYTMIVEGIHNDYLICNDCGRIEKLDMSCPVEALEKQVAKMSGFKKIYHELEFFGQCPDCSG